ncbi:MAG: carbohydrate-binding protein, partial [Acidobacteriota bacterium]
ALAVNAGCDINCGRTLPQYLGQAVDDMLISESTLDHSLIRSFTGRILLGEFDPPEQIPYDKIPISCLESEAHQALAREAARESIVLFKNQNNALPLDKTSLKKIAVIGPMADVCYLGNYSGTPWVRISPLAGIKNALGISTPPSYEKRASDFTSVGSSPGGGLFGFARGPRLESLKEGGQALDSVANGSWAAYHDVLFTGATEFHARVACRGFSFFGQPARPSIGGTLEVHLDSLTGPVVSTVHVPDTGGRENWINVSAAVKPTKGAHTVYLSFSSETRALLGIESFRLTPASPVPAAAKDIQKYCGIFL